MVIFVVLLGVVLAIGSALLVQSLMLQPDPISGGLVGGLLGLALVATLMQGSGVRVERGARLVYHLRGHDSVAVDLRQVTGFRLIKTGVLAGIAIDCPLAALTFLSRKGVTRRQCLACQKNLGAPLILEFLRPADLPPLLIAWRRSLSGDDAAVE